MATTKPTQVVTGEVRISYEHLLKPYSHSPGQEEKYSVTLLIPKSDIATKQKIDMAIQAAISEGVSGKWNGARPAQPPTPIYDGDGVRPNGEAFGPECKGHYVMTASSLIQPEIVDQNRNQILSPTEVYSGMYAMIFLNFFAYNQAGKKGIGCGLGPVMKTRDGEPLGGRVSAADAFGGVAAPQPAEPQYQPQPTYQPQQAYQPQYQALQINPLTGLPQQANQPHVPQINPLTGLPY